MCVCLLMCLCLDSGTGFRDLLNERKKTECGENSRYVGKRVEDDLFAVREGFSAGRMAVTHARRLVHRETSTFNKRKHEKEDYFH